MKKVDFNLAAAAAQGSRLGAATRVMKKHRDVLHRSGVIGVWVGSRASEPYIMLAIKEGSSVALSNTIPDSIEGVNVYFIEGEGVLH